MNNQKTQKRISLLMGIGYITLAILFVLNFITMGNQYEKEEKRHIIDVEKQIKEILDGDRSRIPQSLSLLRETVSLEISVSQKNVPLFSSIPYQNNMLGILNESSILMESQGTYGNYDIWFAVYHMPDSQFLVPFFIQQGAILSFIILLLFGMLYLMRNAMKNPLRLIKDSISKIQDYQFSEISEGTDVINQEFNRFSKDLDSNLQTVSRRYSEFETKLQIERDRLNNAMTVSRSFIHDMKSPIHQSLMENEIYIKEIDSPSVETVRLAQLNIDQSEMVLNTINDVLKIMKNDAFTNIDANESIDLVTMFMKSLNSFKTLFKTNALELDLEMEEQLVINTNKSALFLLIHNLLSNMGHYAPMGSQLKISLLEKADSSIKMMFSNESLPENIQRMKESQHIFNSIESTNKFSGGNGLFLIKDLSKILNGEYSLETSEKDVTITITLPRGETNEVH